MANQTEGPAPLGTATGPDNASCLAARCDPENKPVPTETQAIDAAVVAGAVATLRRRAAVRRKEAEDRSVIANVATGLRVFSPEGRKSLTIAADLEQIAAEIEAVGLR
jgi:hypothetical protein